MQMNTLDRRSLLTGFSCILAAAALPHWARSAEQYPSHPVRIIVPFAAGGLVDVFARVVATQLQAKWGQPFIVENKPGASGNLGAETVFRAQPDGYTLLFAPPPPLAVNKSLFPKLGFDPETLTAVSVFAAVPNVLVINPRVPVSTVPELIAYAKANPGKLSYASTGSGGTPHLTAELLKRSAGIDLVHVPYRGMAPAVLDVIAGQADMIFANLGDTLQHVRAGKLKAIAVASSTRFPGLPDTPTVAEILPGFISDTWYALAAPPGTRPEITEKLAGAIKEALARPELKARLDASSAVPIGNSPAEAAQFIKRESLRWREVIEAAGIKPE
jgi:tripartite-type tricarboxylate transporter receptor subunit TctC